MEEDDDAAVVEGGTTTSPKMITGVVMNGLSSGVGLQDGNEGKEEGADPAEQTNKKIGRPAYMTFEGHLPDLATGNTLRRSNKSSTVMPVPKSTEGRSRNTILETDKQLKIQKI